MSRMLGTIKLDIPWDGDYEELIFHNIFNPESIALLKELEFNTLLAKIDAAETVETIEKSVAFHWVKTAADVDSLINDLKMTNEAIIYYHQERTQIYLALGITDRYYYLNPEAVDGLKFFDKLKNLPNISTLAITSQDLKNLIHIFHENDIKEVNEAFDTYIATYLLSPGDQRYDLKSAAYQYLNRTILDDEESYEEVSASCGIAAAMLAKGNPLHIKHINQAIYGIKQHIGEDGRVTDVSGGTAIMKNREDYRTISKKWIQGWGQGLALTFLAGILDYDDFRNDGAL